MPLADIIKYLSVFFTVSAYFKTALDVAKGLLAAVLGNQQALLSLAEQLYYTVFQRL